MLKGLKVPFERLSREHQNLLTPRELPCARHLWDIWCALSKRRRSGINGAETLGFDQVLDWQQLYCRCLEAWEVKALFAIEDEWFRIVNGIPRKDEEENVD